MPNGEAVDMEFDGVQLRWGTDSWPGISGGFGRGRAPAVLYRVERRQIVPMSAGIAPGFRDPTTGMGFFVPITPLFPTTRSGLGIHPDGNPPGTQGCIGLTARTAAFYNRIRNTPVSANLRLRVLKCQ